MADQSTSYKDIIDAGICRAISRAQSDIQERVQDCLLELKEPDMLAAVKSFPSLSGYETMCLPMMEYLFCECPYESVCAYIVDNIKLSDDDVLTEHLEVLDPSDPTYKWKADLIGKWISHSDREDSSD